MPRGGDEERRPMPRPRDRTSPINTAAVLIHCTIMPLSALMHQSIPAAPIPPPGNCGAFAHPVSSGGGAFANLARPGGRAFAYPGATPGVLTHSWFPTRNTNMEDFIAKDQQFVADWIDRHGLDKLVEFFSILCTSSLLIKAQLKLSLYIARLGTINVNRRTHASLFKDLNKI